PGANERLGSASDSQPDRQWLLQRSRVDALASEWRAMLPRPVDLLALPDLEKQLQLFFEERIVIFESKSKQRKRVHERSTPDDHLRAPTGDQIECCKLLKHAHRICRAQDGDGARETNALRSRGGCAENYGRCGVEKIFPVVLADAK